ncbi:MAG: hypothetical protein ABSB15_08800 [Bryobacteraceae bacterium]|jgi:hypothetical protein
MSHRSSRAGPFAPDRVIGAPRRCIFDQFRSYSPRPDVSCDSCKVGKQATRTLVGAHCDPTNMVRKPDAPELAPEGREPAVGDAIDFERSIEASAPGVTDNAAGYAIVLRASTAPFRERQIFVGKVTEYTLPGLSIDDIELGVRAIDNEGHESPVAPWIAPPYALKTFETTAQP